MYRAIGAAIAFIIFIGSYVYIFDYLNHTLESEETRIRDEFNLYLSDIGSHIAAQYIKSNKTFLNKLLEGNLDKNDLRGVSEYISNKLINITEKPFRFNVKIKVYKSDFVINGEEGFKREVNSLASFDYIVKKPVTHYTSTIISYREYFILVEVGT